MAEVFDSLAEAREKLKDPAGVIAISHVDSYALLPSTPASQTAYRADDTDKYYVYDADLSAWESVELEISDDRLNNLLELYSYDVNKTVRRAITIIIASLYGKMRLTKMSSGSETTEWQTLNDTLSFYKALQAQYKDDELEDKGTSTGRFVFVESPSVGGIKDW